MQIVQTVPGTFDPLTGKDDGDVSTTLSVTMVVYEEDTKEIFPDGVTKTRFFSEFNVGDRMFLFSTRLLASNFVLKRSDKILCAGETYEIKEFVTIDPLAGYAVRGRRTQ